MAAVENVTLTFDIWTSQYTTTSYLGGSVHFLNGVAMETCTLSVTELSEAHDAAYISSVMEKVCADWGVTKAQTNLVVTDGAANITKAAQNTFGSDKTAPCFDHVLALIPAYVLQKDKDKKEHVPGAAALIGKVKRIVTFFHHSVRASDALKKIQISKHNKTAATALRLVQEEPTRWSSCYQMLQRFLELTPVVAEVLLNFGDVTMLSGTELSTIRIFVKVLKPFAQITEEMSADTTTTASKVIPFVTLLIKSVAAIEIPPEDAVATSLKKFVLSELGRRFGQVENNMHYAVACLLDPRFKKIHFQSPRALANTITKISTLIKEQFHSEEAAAAAELAENAANRAQDAQADDDLWSLHDAAVESHRLLYSEDVSGGMPVELGQYLNRPVMGTRKSNPFVLWESIKDEYKHLYKIVMQYLPAIATSVPSERLFSEARLVLTDHRSRISSDHLKMYIFLSSCSQSLWESTLQ